MAVLAIPVIFLVFALTSQAVVYGFSYFGRNIVESIASFGALFFLASWMVIIALAIAGILDNPGFWAVAISFPIFIITSIIWGIYGAFKTLSRHINRTYAFILVLTPFVMVFLIIPLTILTWWLVWVEGGINETMYATGLWMFGFLLVTFLSVLPIRGAMHLTRRHRANPGKLFITMSIYWVVVLSFTVVVILSFLVAWGAIPVDSLPFFVSELINLSGVIGVGIVIIVLLVPGIFVLDFIDKMLGLTSSDNNYSDYIETSFDIFDGGGGGD